MDNCLAKQFICCTEIQCLHVLCGAIVSFPSPHRALSHSPSNTGTRRVNGVESVSPSNSSGSCPASPPFKVIKSPSPGTCMHGTYIILLCTFLNVAHQLRGIPWCFPLYWPLGIVLCNIVVTKLYASHYPQQSYPSITTPHHSMSSCVYRCTSSRLPSTPAPPASPQPHTCCQQWNWGSWSSHTTALSLPSGQ